ncbi:DUF1080 domain-containing protein [Termitidicoccus mucosus]|uniref:3-keto-alpha-glucoside-1,2-lyase/3-keto-2-hydroxy-glucal hydratase domain-containing protein n=1 Tax=Termitidicoccus mucosus TaxID=1184151 RepID=A0A178IIG2_9BACT|nr:hypothetical protein AW736_12035 [Opitutaceae bacterium TSB47]
MNNTINLSKFIFVPVLALALAGTACAQKPAPLFNGKNLDGWVQRGGKAKYHIEGNEIVGTSMMGTPNTFLCTAKTYGDFILEYEFKVDQRLNSGVQIRSECLDTDIEFTLDGTPKKIAAGRVHGYQIEIDPDVPRARMWSAGIYDEARRGWLFPKGKQQEATFSALGRTIFKPDDWNHVRVEAIGDSIKTWINGTPCADIIDSMTARGFIALQVHSIGKDKNKDGTQVRWRNLTITEFPDVPTTVALNTLTPAEKATGWKLLWDGKTTKGWRSAKTDTFPAKGWVVKDGILTVQANGGQESAAGGDIITRERYTDFELRLEFKMTPGTNSGIKYFVQPNLDPISGTGAKAAVGSAIGLEYQILDDALHPDAKLGRDGNRTLGSLYDLIPAAADKKPNSTGEWNTARIIVRGNHIEHWLDGEKVLEYDRDTPAFHEAVANSKYKNIPHFGEWSDGHILLQEHGNEVSYRNIKIRIPAKQ